ncbi:MAG: Ig-like domain repeat protein [Acidimicrobiales bacterium]|jgi:hypothetical protein
MKPVLKAAAAGLLTAAIAGAGLLGLAGAAFAAGSAPPFEPDAGAASYGSIAFYDAAGNQVTSGTNDLSNPFQYAVASTAADTNAKTATVFYANPQHGVSTGLWVVTNEAASTFSPSSSLPAGTPADVKAFAPTDPVAATSGSSITAWLAANTPDTTTGYANTIQVRIQDSGGGGAGNLGTTTYWRTDIGYNTTSSAITVDGTTVPANGWAVLYPIPSNPTITTLTAPANGANEVVSNPITLTATVSPSSSAGSVSFYSNGGATPVATSTTPGSGTYTATWTPTVTGTDSITATFIPTAGGPGSIGDGVTITVGAANIAGTPTLSASQTSITAGTPDTLTATVTYADNSLTGVAGTVKFMIGATLITGCTNPVATTVTGAGTTASPGVGTATCTTSALPQGTDNVIMTFTPPAGYTPLFAGPVTVTVAAPAICSGNSACSDTQNIQVAINPGTITITTPYTASNPFVLPPMTLSSDGTYLSSTALFPASSLPNSQNIVVTSMLSPAYAWTLSVSASPLTSSGGGTILASGLGLTAGTLLNPGTGAGGTYPGTVTFTNIPGLNPSPVDGGGTGPGLSGTPQTWATSAAVDGTAEMDGTLTLYAPTSTPSGTYNGTITFSVS